MRNLSSAMIYQIASDAMAPRSTRKACHARNATLLASCKLNSSRTWTTFSKLKLENTALRNIRSSWCNIWSRRRKSKRQLFMQGIPVMGARSTRLWGFDTSARLGLIMTFAQPVRRDSSLFRTQCSRSDIQVMLQRIWCARTRTLQI